MRVQWELNGGATAAFAGPRPSLTRENELVLDAWRFCGPEWSPERIVLAAAYYGVKDLAGLIDGLIVVRDAIEAWRKAQRDHQERMKRG